MRTPVVAHIQKFDILLKDLLNTQECQTSCVLYDFNINMHYSDSDDSDHINVRVEYIVVHQP